MKKILLIILMLASAPLIGQSLYTNGGFTKSIDSLSLAADTAYYMLLPKASFISAQFVWTGATATDAEIVPMMSDDGVNYHYFPDADSLAISTAAGNGIIRNASNATVERYFKFEIKHGTNTAGTLKLYVNIFHRNLIY